MSKTVTCPLCKGEGQVPKNKSDQKYEDIKQLVDQGFSYRYIADVLDIASVATVHYYLKLRPKTLTIIEEEKLQQDGHKIEQIQNHTFEHQW